MKTKIVVGNKFKEFADEQNVVTLDQMRAFASHQTSCLPWGDMDLMIGQGISKSEMRSINYINDTHIGDLQALTHKHDKKNILITNPVKKSETEYFCSLSIDDACAEMSDHQTGQHIQGALLVEAARQMVIAVTEKYFFSEDKEEQKSFITHSIQSKFKAFVFPLAVNMTLNVLECKKSMHSNLAAKVEIKFFQNNVELVEVIFVYSALSSKYVKSREELLARQAIEKFIKNRDKQSIPDNEK